MVEVTTQAEFIAAINDNVCISLKRNIDLTTNITVADAPTGIVIPDATTGFIIDGNGFSLDGAGAMRCMYIGKNAAVQINRLTITNGYTSEYPVWSKHDCGALARLDSHDDDPARPSFLYHLLVWFDVSFSVSFFLSFRAHTGWRWGLRVWYWSDGEL